MDSRFDGFSKLLATGFSRREAVKWFTASVFGHVAARAVGATAIGAVGGAAIGTLIDGGDTVWAQGSSNCAHFCNSLPPGTRSQCLHTCKACLQDPGQLCGAAGNIACCPPGSFCCGITC